MKLEEGFYVCVYDRVCSEEALGAAYVGELFCGKIKNEELNLRSVFIKTFRERYKGYCFQTKIFHIFNGCSSILRSLHTA